MSRKMPPAFFDTIFHKKGKKKGILGIQQIHSLNVHFTVLKASCSSSPNYKTNVLGTLHMFKYQEKMYTFESSQLSCPSIVPYSLLIIKGIKTCFGIVIDTIQVCNGSFCILGILCLCFGNVRVFLRFRIYSVCTGYT